MPKSPKHVPRVFGKRHSSTKIHLHGHQFLLQETCSLIDKFRVNFWEKGYHSKGKVWTNIISQMIVSLEHTFPPIARCIHLKGKLDGPSLNPCVHYSLVHYYDFELLAWQNNLHMQYWGIPRCKMFIQINIIRTISRSKRFIISWFLLIFPSLFLSYSDNPSFYKLKHRTCFSFPLIYNLSFHIQSSELEQFG